VTHRREDRHRRGWALEERRPHQRCRAADLPSRVSTAAVAKGREGLPAGGGAPGGRGVAGLRLRRSAPEPRRLLFAWSRRESRGPREEDWFSFVPGPGWEGNGRVGPGLDPSRGVKRRLFFFLRVKRRGLNEGCVLRDFFLFYI